MAFIRTIPVTEASGEVRDMYERTQASLGYVPNYAQAFSLRPAVMAAWSNLLSSIRANLDPRRYELVTLAAARALGSSYCSLAHASALACASISTRRTNWHPSPGISRPLASRRPT